MCGSCFGCCVYAPGEDPSAYDPLDDVPSQLRRGSADDEGEETDEQGDGESSSELEVTVAGAVAGKGRERDAKAC